MLKRRNKITSLINESPVNSGLFLWNNLSGLFLKVIDVRNENLPGWKEVRSEFHWYDYPEFIVVNHMAPWSRKVCLWCRYRMLDFFKTTVFDGYRCWAGRQQPAQGCFLTRIILYSFTIGCILCTCSIMKWIESGHEIRISVIKWQFLYSVFEKGAEIYNGSFRGRIILILQYRVLFCPSRKKSSAVWCATQPQYQPPHRCRVYGLGH